MMRVVSRTANICASGKEGLSQEDGCKAEDGSPGAGPTYIRENLSVRKVDVCHGSSELYKKDDMNRRRRDKLDEWSGGRGSLIPVVLTNQC